GMKLKINAPITVPSTIAARMYCVNLFDMGIPPGTTAPGVWQIFKTAQHAWRVRTFARCSRCETARGPAAGSARALGEHLASTWRLLWRVLGATHAGAERRAPRRHNPLAIATKAANDATRRPLSRLPIREEMLRIAVIGGGPGGLYFAYLWKKRHPED